MSLRDSLDDATAGRLQGHPQSTDLHLAPSRRVAGGRLVTFDGRLRRSLDGTRLAPAVPLVE